LFENLGYFVVHTVTKVVSVFVHFFHCAASMLVIVRQNCPSEDRTKDLNKVLPRKQLVNGDSVAVKKAT
jgi:hypothetical protein